MKAAPDKLLLVQKYACLKYGQQGKQPQFNWNVSCGNRIKIKDGNDFVIIKKGQKLNLNCTFHHLRNQGEN